MILVFLITVFVDLIFAVGVGVLAASLALIYQVNKVARVECYKKGEAMVVAIRGAFFFGSSSKLAAAIANQKDKTLIIDISSMPFVDLSGIYAMEDEIAIKLENGDKIYLVLNNEQKLVSLRNLVGDDKICRSIDEAVGKIGA